MAKIEKMPLRDFSLYKANSMPICKILLGADGIYGGVFCSGICCYSAYTY